ncbi:hypothetical protein FSP39_017296 [Pinctada imbricata]|uniref:DED domain-containing protein n=1 Tax=Pinctada imbricata TaxID=66713 RepID=A0AA88YW34_PINIB|nr:hypothetical protein FSP39_017296 [Pinctada imbricata]
MEEESSKLGFPLSLHEMFRIVGEQMTCRDIRTLKYLYKGIMPADVVCRVHEGYDFLLALERMNRVDETNFKYIMELLRIITRHDLLQYVTLRRRQAVQEDPVNVFLERRQNEAVLSCQPDSPIEVTSGVRKRRSSCQERTTPEKCCRKSLSRRAKTNSGYGSSVGNHDNSESAVSMAVRAASGQQSGGEKSCDDRKVTCDIRLRVRAEYCDHSSALDGNVFSNKPTLLEQQFEKFSQASTILKSRDLGSIVCDIKFVELTYLDAFWRDYVNGSLLEALKGVFITESLKQAVGNEAVKLLVSVDEGDYERGRVKLLQNEKR